MKNIFLKNYFRFFIATFFLAFFFAIAVPVSHSQVSNLLQKRSGNQNVDFVIDWAADTYTPPEYEGKPLPTYGTSITLSATPISLIDEGDFEFNWLIDMAFVPSDNGKPKAAFSVRKTSGGEHIIYLNIIDKKTKETIKDTSFTIPIAAPQNLIYRETASGHFLPLNTANVAASGSRLNLIAKPFFFNKTRNGQALKYQWELNNQAIEGIVSDPDKLFIEFPKEIISRTQYNLALTIENPLDAFQFAENNYKITIR